MSYVYTDARAEETYQYFQEREQKRDLEELSALAAKGEPVYGPSDLPDFVQGVAHRNSVFSQLVSWFHAYVNLNYTSVS